MASQIMVGGAKFQELVIEWSKKSTNLYTVVFAIIIAVWALYSNKMSADVRWQLSTTPGRLLLLLLLYIVYNLYGWTIALLFTIAIALTWASRPIYKPAKEGFNDVKSTEASCNQWFVEKVLHQTPTKIVEDRVETTAIDEDTPTTTERTSK
jgi:predicted membrane protein